MSFVDSTLVFLLLSFYIVISWNMPLLNHRARAQSNKINKQMIGKMAIATALRGFNDLGHSVTPTFLSKNRFHLQGSTHCPKMNKN